MNKTKFTSGVLLAVIGGIISITSMVSGIIYIAGGLYKDINTFPLKLSDSEAPLQEAFRTPDFPVKSNNLISVWLKVPDRKIENKDFSITGSIREKTGKVITDFDENFKFGYFRNSYGEGQYYRLCKHYFEIDSEVYLSYTTSGEWTPPYKVALVVRQSKSFSIPMKEIVFFIIGIFILITGIGSIVKNR